MVDKHVKNYSLNALFKNKKNNLNEIYHNLKKVVNCRPIFALSLKHGYKNAL